MLVVKVSVFQICWTMAEWYQAEPALDRNITPRSPRRSKTLERNIAPLPKRKVQVKQEADVQAKPDLPVEELLPLLSDSESEAPCSASAQCSAGKRILTSLRHSY